MNNTPSKTDRDLEALTALWNSATPEAKRAFAETHFAMDGWPSAVPIRECDAFYGARWSSRK